MVALVKVMGAILKQLTRIADALSKQSKKESKEVTNNVGK